MSSPTSELRATSPSVSSLAKSQSVRSKNTQAAPSRFRSIVTSPPWASDEPPSPIDQHAPLSASVSSVNARPSQSALSTNDESASASNHTITHPYGQKDEPLWWMFTRRGRQEGPPQQLSAARHNWPTIPSKPGNSSEKRERPLRERARSTWLAGAQRIRHPKHSETNGDQDEVDMEERRRSWGFSIPLPTPTPITISQNRTPGWDTPWSPRASQPLVDSDEQRSGSRQGSIGNGNNTDDLATGRPRSKWYRRRKRMRAFILNNNYVPLLFRMINMALTTGALAEAIKIRQKEMKFGIMGAVGSSPTLVIIFAPLTLVHVMIAIYLEYLGRPLGLWRTSNKLIHTLSETLFICAWSAALSLCFDNFFTSVIGCASPSSTAWYNEIPRITPNNPNLGRGEGLPGDYICDNQMALICLVFLGLVMYCTNLCISLFRIFEKVKYHPVVLPR